jgi:tetratricopeptide (TPR) repeat protein
MWWLMNYCRNIDLRGSLACGCLAALLMAGARPVYAQDIESRYQQGVDLFNNARMEEACEVLQEVEKEKPGYKQIKTYLNPACSQAKRLVKMEEDLFNEGVQFFNQGRYDDAKLKFDQASKIRLKNPRYRTQISRYLRDIEGRQNEERQFQEAVKLFDAGKYSEAQTRFSSVAQGGGARAAEARNYLTRVGDALRQQRAVEETNKLFNDGVRLFNTGKHAEAQANFEKVVGAGGPKAAQARAYLQKLEQMARAQQAPPPKPAAGPSVAATTTPQPGSQGGSTSAAGPGSSTSANEQLLRLGLEAYFDGKFDEAERALTDYLDNHGSKPALALFFRGASQGTRYYLSGEKDTRRKDLAEADFRALKERAARFQPPDKYVSPKILALYSEAVHAP